MNCLKYLFLVCCVSLCCSGYALAQDAEFEVIPDPGSVVAVDVDGGVSLSWDQNTESDLDHYGLYVGSASGNYDELINVGKKTSYTVTGLTVGETYYFALTASDTWKNESGYSAEVSAVAKDIILPKPPKSFREVTPNINNLRKGN